MYFTEDKLAGVTCVMTGPTIQDLNWQAGSSYIANVEDLTGRLKSYGLLTDSAAQQTGENLFPDPAVSTYSPVYGIGSNSLLQPGYLAKSAENSKFRLAFIVASGEFADNDISLPGELPAEADSETSSSPEESVAGSSEVSEVETQSEPIEGLWTLLYYTIVGNNHQVIDSWDFLEGNLRESPLELDSMHYIFRNDGTFGRFEILDSKLTCRTGTWTKNVQAPYPSFYLTLFDGTELGEYWLSEASDDMSNQVGNVHLQFRRNDANLELASILNQFFDVALETAPIASEESAANISLSVSSNEVEIGNMVDITVSASGADGIRLYRKRPYGSYELFHEAEGNSLEFRFSFIWPGSHTLYAVASYNGVWSDTQSNVETVTFLPREIFAVGFHEESSAGITFDITIYECKDASDYLLQIYDADGTLIRENHVDPGYHELDPLPEGNYRLTVTSIGKTTQIMEGDFVISRGGYSESIVHEGHVVQDENDPEVQYQRGLDYYTGNGVEQDYGKAFEWFLKAAEQGHIFAQTWIGVFYKEGLGVEQDDEKSVYWYQTAADQGYYLAQYFLGQSYLLGEGVEQDYEKAVPLYQAAAEQGYVYAQNDLGSIYFQGEIVEQDYEQSAYWYQLAAEQGWPQSQTMLGVLYYYGLGVEKDAEQAKYWLQQASDAGFEQAAGLIAEFFPEE